ncbi:MAG: hypothetical protein U0M08_02665 [Clostridia bacterium]|nr:hypothetical protein [Clostridia bacterium]
MKKFLILTAVLSVFCMTAVSFVSCGPDNDNDGNNAQTDNLVQGTGTDGVGGAAPGLNPSPSQNG